MIGQPNPLSVTGQRETFRMVTFIFFAQVADVISKHDKPYPTYDSACRGVYIGSAEYVWVGARAYFINHNNRGCCCYTSGACYYYPRAYRPPGAMFPFMFRFRIRKYLCAILVNCIIHQCTIIDRKALPFNYTMIKQDDKRKNNYTHLRSNLQPNLKKRKCRVKSQKKTANYCTYLTF